MGGVVPDYRGMFLRGHGSQVSTHYGHVVHQSGALGNIQGDSIRNITGDIVGDPMGGDGSNGYSEFFGDDTAVGYGAFYVGNWRHQQGIVNTGPGSYSRPHSFHFSASNVAPTDVENRPVNKSVRYLIRSRP